MSSNLLPSADCLPPFLLLMGRGGLASDRGSVRSDAGMSTPLVVTDQNSSELPFMARSIDVLRGAGLSPSLLAARSGLVISDI
ncbi:MAG: hypothetical protein KTR25_10320 [Myxococcales bacterium]|nr:hypothetical protein [Myxococcales bacterium]